MVLVTEQGTARVTLMLLSVVVSRLGTCCKQPTIFYAVLAVKLPPLLARIGMIRSMYSPCVYRAQQGHFVHCFCVSSRCCPLPRYFQAHYIYRFCIPKARPIPSTYIHTYICSYKCVLPAHARNPARTMEGSRPCGWRE